MLLRGFLLAHSHTTGKAAGGTTGEVVLGLAEAPDLVRFDRLAGCRDQPHLFVAIADQDAGYGDCSTSVCRLSAN